MKLTRLFILSALFLAACGGNNKENGKRLVDYVDPYIGSGGHGHVFVGASVPFGAVQLGPNNIHKGWDWCSGYHYSDSIVIGFSHTHLNGTGCSAMGDIRLMPYPGEIRINRGEQDNIDGAYASFYSHDNETVEPAYYSLLMDNGVRTELTATTRVGMHRYTYPAGEERRLMIDLTEGNGDITMDTYMTIVDEHTVEGYRFSRGWSPGNKVFFTLRTDTPIKYLDLFGDGEVVSEKPAEGKIKGVVTFEPGDKPVQVKVGISSVSIKNAAENIREELPGWDFEQVRKEGTELWERELSRIKIETGDERLKTIFYTALYHTAISPTHYCDANGEFRGHDDIVYSDASHTNYSTLSLWDTYRTLNPLFTIIHPDMVPDIINSMLGMYDQQGYLPIWPLWGGETHTMPGYSSVQVIADAYLKGIGGFDPQRALEACLSTATNPKMPGIDYVISLGYIPCDRKHESVSYGMEYAVADWGVARMAEKLGRENEARTFSERADYFRNYFDGELGLVRPKLEDGSWKTPYDPFNSIHFYGDFCEGNGWHYSFFAPQHPELLIELFGGEEEFTEQLDALFLAEGDMGEQASPDISGLIGQYAHGNEPSHHVIYMYPFAGQQWKTAEKARHIMKEFYTDQPDGIIGNEDCGQMSAWLIMSSLGFYQLNPSNGIFVFGSPLFEKAQVELPGGKTFTVEAPNNSGENVYIQSAELNGKPWQKSYITYNDIMNGGTLRFKMGSRPNYNFGALKEDRPTSKPYYENE